MSFRLKFSKSGFSSISRNSHSVILSLTRIIFSHPLLSCKLHLPLCTPPSGEAEKREREVYFPIFPSFLPLASLIQNTWTCLGKN